MKPHDERAHAWWPPDAARRVLVVEDDRRLRGMLIASITEMDLLPTGATSAEAAMKLIAAGEVFAVALVDLNLPGMDGLDLCERLRQQTPAAELIILTGFGDLEAARRAIRLEVVDFLTKPCGMDDLEHALVQARLRWLDRSLQAAPIPDPPAEPAPAPLPPAPTTPSGAPLMEDVERQLILAALSHHHGNRQLAAAEVGISVRTLYYRLKQYQQMGATSEPAHED